MLSFLLPCAKGEQSVLAHFLKEQKTCRENVACLLFSQKAFLGRSLSAIVFHRDDEGKTKGGKRGEKHRQWGAKEKGKREEKEGRKAGINVVGVARAGKSPEAARSSRKTMPTPATAGTRRARAPIGHRTVRRRSSAGHGRRDPAAARCVRVKRVVHRSRRESRRVSAMAATRDAMATLERLCDPARSATRSRATRHSGCIETCREGVHSRV